MTGDPLGSVRASSWPTLFSCALRWYYQNIEGLRTPTSGAAWTGTSMHRATQVLDDPVTRGEEAGDIELATQTYVHCLHEPDEEVRWTADDTPMPEVERNGVRLLSSYRALYSNERKWLAVELTCPDLDIETDYGTVRLTGTVDRVEEERGIASIADIKTGKNAVTAAGKASVSGHHMQLGIYTLLAENALQRPIDPGGEIIGMSMAGTRPLIASGYVANARTPLIGTDEYPGLIEMAAQMLKTGMFPPNPKDMLCSEKYCAGWHKCVYRAR